MSRIDEVHDAILREPRRVSDELTSRGRALFGTTPPSGAMPCPRSTPLSAKEVEEVVALISQGRRDRQSVFMDERLMTRDWPSVEEVVLTLSQQSGHVPAGWKVGAASQEIRDAEGLPSPSPGRIYEHTIFPNQSLLGESLFINFRNVECEFAFTLARDFDVRDTPYTESEVVAGIDSLLPALEIGDTVFLDWYGASGYFGSCLDNGGGAAFVGGTRCSVWRAFDLADSEMDLYLNEFYLKSGTGRAAMGHPVTSLTWMINWACSHGVSVLAGEVISTGTCTGHCFAAPGDVLSANFGPLGVVQVEFQ